MKRSILGFWVLTISLVFITAFCVTGTVMSQTKMEERALENYYRAQEQEMVSETREYLSQSGFQNSGVMLTRVVEADGSREYTVTIHHGKIDNMDEGAKENLKKELSAFVFSADNCTFYHEFLVTD